MSELLAKYGETTRLVYFSLLVSSSFGPGGSLTPVKTGAGGSEALSAPLGEEFEASAKFKLPGRDGGMFSRA